MGFLFTAALAVTLGGCGAASPDDVMKEAVACLNDTAEVFENIKKETETAESAKPKLEKLAERWKVIRGKLDALKLSEADRKRLEESFKEETAKAVSRLSKAEMELSTADREALKDLRKRFES